MIFNMKYIMNIDYCAEMYNEHTLLCRNIWTFGATQPKY